MQILSRLALKVLPVIFAFICNHAAMAQCVITMDGAVNIDVPSGTFFGVTGDVVLQNATPVFDNKGTVHITGNWTNNGTIGAGLATSGGAPTTGTVILEGNTQTIGGSTATTFYNLTLAGTAASIKTLNIGATVNALLALGDHQFATLANTLIVGTGGSITYTVGSGFVSSTAGGFLQRNTNSTATYHFPVGSTTGGFRFRPFDIAPATTTGNSYKVRFVPNSPNTDGFTTSSTDGTICSPLSVTFYHRVVQTSADNATLTMYFSSGIDGVYTKMAHWQGAPVWTTMDPVTYTSGAFFGLTDRVSKTAWGNYTFEPFALANPGLPAVVTATAATVPNCNTYTANWGAATDAFGYYLDVSTSNLFGSFVGSYNALNVGNVTTLGLTGLTAGTTYYYRLRSWNGCGTQPTYSNIISFTTPTATVGPTTLSASNNPVCSTSSSTTLTQSGGTLGTGASWEWHTNNTYTALVNTNTNANASYTPSPATTTTYWLRATNGAGYTCTPITNGPVGGVTVTVRQPITGTYTYSNPTSCSTSNGSITVSGVAGGSGAYNYSSNGTTYQASASFTTIASGTSNSVYVRNSDNAPGCPVVLGTYTMNQPYTPIAAPTLANNLPDLCSSNIATLTVSNLEPGNGGFNNTGGYTFNGTNQYAFTATMTGMPTGSVTTAEAWIKPASGQVEGTWGGVVGYGPASCTNRFLLAVQSNGVPAVANWCNDFVPSTTQCPALVQGVWSHLSAVLNGTSLTIYINGQLAASTTLGSTPAISATSQLTVGCTDPGGARFFKGDIANVRIWNVARTQTQIRNDMYLDNPTVATGLVARYNFNSNTGFNAQVGNNLAGVNAPTAITPNFYTYSWTGATPSGSNPPNGTNEVVTTGALTGTSPFQVSASFNGCTGTQSNTAPSNDFGGAYTVTLETAGTGNAVNVVLPGNGGNNAYGHAAGVGYSETGLITATGGGAWDRCVNWGMPVTSTASSGPRIGFGVVPTTTMQYLTNLQANSTTNLAGGIVCYSATLAVPTNFICANATCSSWYTGNVTVYVTLAVVNNAGTAIPLDYTSSGHIMMRSAQNFKIRSSVKVLVPASGIQYYSCAPYSNANTLQPILDWYDCCYKNPAATGFTYSFNYNSFPKFTFTSAPSAGTNFSVCVGGQPASTIKLQGNRGSLTASCGALLEYWDGPGGYVSAGTLLAPTGSQFPAAITTSTSPTTFGTYNYTISQGTAALSNICYGTSSVTVTQNVPVVGSPFAWPNGAAGTSYLGTTAPSTWDPSVQVIGNDSWYDNRNWDHCVPDAATNAFINYNATNPANINSNVVGYWGANAKARAVKIDVPNSAKVIINANGTTKLNVTD